DWRLGRLPDLPFPHIVLATSPVAGVGNLEHPVAKIIDHATAAPAYEPAVPPPAPPCDGGWWSCAQGSWTCGQGLCCCALTTVHCGAWLLHRVAARSVQGVDLLGRRPHRAAGLTLVDHAARATEDVIRQRRSARDSSGLVLDRRSADILEGVPVHVEREVLAPVLEDAALCPLYQVTPELDTTRGGLVQLQGSRQVAAGIPRYHTSAQG